MPVNQSKKTFEAIGAYLRGLESISSDTLNIPSICVDKIQVNKKLCGFILSTIEITNEERENIFLNFGGIEQVDRPCKVEGALFAKDFIDPINVVCLSQVMQEEEVEFNSLNPDLEFLLPSWLIPNFSRNPLVCRSVMEGPLLHNS